jgi:3-hydroxybutyryl-CoA dehydrogenase
MATKRPDKVIGTHFFNPVPVMKLLEIVTTIVSSEESLNTVKVFGQSLGKVIVIAKDTPAFIANRIAVPMFIEAMKVYEAGLATKEDIDNAMVHGYNHSALRI